MNVALIAPLTLTAATWLFRRWLEQFVLTSVSGPPCMAHTTDRTSLAAGRPRG